jgi:protein CpxP
MVRRQMMQGLNLTDAQKEQAKAIFQQSRQTAQPVAEQLRQNRQPLADAVKANNVGQIQALAAQQGTLHGQLLAIRSEAMAKFYSILTPEQRARADQRQQRVRERMKQRLEQRRSRMNG